MCFFAIGGLLEETDNVVGNAAQIALAVRRNNSQQTLTSLLGQVGLLENTLRGVNVWQIQSSTRMARVEDGSEANTSNQRLNHDAMHFVVGNMATLAEIYGVNDFIVSVGLVSIEVLGLTTMARVMEKQRIVGAGVLDKPVHGAQDVLLGRLTHGVLLVVGENDHIFSLVTEVLC